MWCFFFITGGLGGASSLCIKVLDLGVLTTGDGGIRLLAMIINMNTNRGGSEMTTKVEKAHKYLDLVYRYRDAVDKAHARWSNPDNFPSKSTFDLATCIRGEMDNAGLTIVNKRGRK